MNFESFGRVILSAAVLLAAVTALAQQPAQSSSPQQAPEEKSQDGCSSGQGELHQPLGSGYVLNIRPSDDMEAPCWAEILNSAGKEVYGNNNYAVRLHQATGLDIDGDGKPEVVIEAFSGGAHCCWEYGIVSLVTPLRTAKIRNGHPIAFKEMDGKITLCTYDRAFDYFEASYADSPTVDVFLRLENGKLHDVGTEFRSEYDRRIAAARQQLPTATLERFRSSGPDPEKPEVKTAVLSIALEYLYSGRDAEAWKTLDEMWPPADRKRIQEAILNARGMAGSVWSQLNSSHTGAR
jgi:hypothetical protein